MTFEFKNLGAIKEAQIEMGRLTVISGKNNTGKTYLTHAMTGFFCRELHNLNTISLVDDKEVTQIAETLFSEGGVSINFIDFEKYIFKHLKNKVNIYKNSLHQMFNIDAKFTKDLDIKLKNGTINYGVILKGRVYFSQYDIHYFKELDSSIVRLELFLKKNIDNKLYKIEHIKDVLGIIIKDLIQPSTIILSNVRNATNLFSKSLRYRGHMVERKKIYDAYEIIETDELTKIVDYSHQNALHHTNDWENKAPLAIEEIANYIENIFHIKYFPKKRKNYIQFNQKIIPSHICSASVQALSDLHFYLKYFAKKGDLLVIDEPELNLHPENQIKIARLLVKLVNTGIRVWITTHSDYIVKELNNCLMLSNDFTDKEAFMQEYGYEEEDILKKEDIRVYIAHEEGTVEQVEIGKFGIKKSTFDEAIKRFNEVSDTLFNILE